MRAGWSLTLLLLACAARPASPFMGDERYLRAGIDPDARVNEVVEAMKKAGHREVARQRGKHFTALAFADEGGQPSAVRVVTATGTALAVDGRRADAIDPAFAVGLVTPPGAADVDGDGFEEVFVSRRRGDGPACLSVYRVRDVGFVDPVRVEAGPLGEGACVLEVRDVDGDGRAELVARWSPRLDGTGTLEVRAALFARRHAFALDAAAARAFDAAAAQEATVRLLQARGSEEPGEALAIAVELGLIGYLSGGPDAAVVQFDEALAGLPPGAVDAVWAARVRAFLRDPASRGGSPPVP